MATTPATPGSVTDAETDDVADRTPPTPPPSYPPYPPYRNEPMPPSLAETIFAGHDLRLKYKPVQLKSLIPPPRPAKPRGPKATDVKMSRRAWRAHVACLRRNCPALTDRLEKIAKPSRRNVINMWRDNAYHLPADIIARLRAMLDADEPFKPDQAYEYFVNMKRTKKKMNETTRVKEIKKDMLSLCEHKRFRWARNATITLARGIQRRLSRSGRYALVDGMARLSDIILREICASMHMRTPSRRSTKRKSKFMIEMSDKIAVWIDEILSEAEDRMLMMDFDEDEEVLQVLQEEEMRKEAERNGSARGSTTTASTAPGSSAPSRSSSKTELPKKGSKSGTLTPGTPKPSGSANSTVAPNDTAATPPPTPNAEKKSTPESPK